MMSELWTHKFFGNELSAYLVAVAILAGGWIGVSILKWAVLGRLKRWAQRSATPLDDFLVGAAEKLLVPLLYYGVLVLAARSLALNPALQKTLSVLGAALLTFCSVRFILDAIRFLLLGVWLPHRPDADNLERQLKAIMPILTVAVWGLGIVFLLDNLGFKISAVVAGLGIGGVAVALGAQAVLGDMFSYLAIMLDRPFELDDFIIVGDFMGTVEHIGIKTTRLRSLSGEQLVFSNKDLTDSRVRNYKRMQIRRVVFKIGVTYDTPIEKLRRGVEAIKRIISDHADTRLDRAHFFAFGSSSLDLEVVYYVLSADYNQYMDIQQDLNYAIMAAFQKEGIEFAFPTQTVFVKPGAADIAAPAAGPR